MPVVLAGACVALGGIIYRQHQGSLSRGNSAEGARHHIARVVMLPPEAAFTMRPIEDFAAILERTIFSPSRRPPVGDAPDISEPERSPLNFLLQGVVISSAQRQVLVLPEDGEKVTRLEVGGLIRGWTVVAIQPDTVTFRRETVERTLGLRFEAPPPPQKQAKSARDRRLHRTIREAALSPERDPSAKPLMSPE